MLAAISSRRFWFTHFFVLTLFLLIGYQLTQLMLIRGAALEEIAFKQHHMIIEIPPIRGAILDRHGRELAANLKVPSIYAAPRLMLENEKPELQKELSSILDLSPGFIKDRLERNKSFVWLKRRVNSPAAEKILEMGHPALGMLEEFKRFYPQGNLLAQVLGFTDLDGNGLEGIELYLNKELQGRAGKRYTKRDALGREIKAFEKKQIPSIDGHRITLTIDQYIQYLTERALDRATEQWRPKGAFAIVMEADTGKILAMANWPTFDPNHYQESGPEERRNRAITDMYEPGSVFKIVTASAALNENVVTTETIFNCENGEYNYGSKVLHDVHAYGNLSFEDVIVKSSNIGTVKIASRLGPQTLYRYVKAFGFGDPNGIDMPGEAPGFIRPPSQWSKTSDRKSVV